MFALYQAEGKVEPTSALRSDTPDAIGLTPQRAQVARLSHGILSFLDAWVTAMGISSLE